MVIVVPEEFDGTRRCSLCDKIIDAIQDAKRGIGGRRGYFLDGDFACFHIEENKIGMRAADIDAEAVTGIGCHY